MRFLLAVLVCLFFLCGMSWPDAASAGHCGSGGCVVVRVIPAPQAAPAPTPPAASPQPKVIVRVGRWTPLRNLLFGKPGVQVTVK